MGVLSEDTSPAAEQVLIQLLRSRSARERLNQLQQCVRAGRQLHQMGLRMRHPEWPRERIESESGGEDWMQADPVRLLVEVADILTRLGIDYFATGSIGSTLYGEPRYTQDIDLVVALRPEQAAELFRSVEHDFYADLGAMREAIMRASSFNGRLAAQHISVVVLSTRLEETYFTNEAKIRGDSGVLQGGRSHRAALFRVWKLATPRGGRGRT
ncbi:hypothetical protein DYH09_23435 [bacterium CPR1]|nr:hypothetical protein [bacterium CPR1]